MGALPKRKTARARKGKRRSHHSVVAPALVPCPKCSAMRLPHHVCPTCGSYDGREVVEIKTPKPKAS